MDSQTRIEGTVGTTSLASYYSAIYWWMVVGMLISALTAFVTISTPQGQAAFGFLASIGGLLPFIYLAIVIGIQKVAMRIPAELSKAVFFAFTAFNGVLLSSIAVIYTAQSLVGAFLGTAALFVGLALYGQRTQKDLSSWGTVIQAGMYTAIGVGLVNFFFLKNTMLSTVLAAAVILIFSASIAYSNQQYKALYQSTLHDNEMQKRSVVLGAIQMYISFVAIFESLLHLFGSRD